MPLPGALQRSSSFAIAGEGSSVKMGAGGVRGCRAVRCGVLTWIVQVQETRDVQSLDGAATGTNSTCTTYHAFTRYSVLPTSDPLTIRGASDRVRT